MIPALESGRVAAYVTDFPDNRIANAAGVIALPHLGASTPESEDNCAIMAATSCRTIWRTATSPTPSICPPSAWSAPARPGSA